MVVQGPKGDCNAAEGGREGYGPYRLREVPSKRRWAVPKICRRKRNPNRESLLFLGIVCSEGDRRMPQGRRGGVRGRKNPLRLHGGKKFYQNFP